MLSDSNVKSGVITLVNCLPLQSVKMKYTSMYLVRAI